MPQYWTRCLPKPGTPGTTAAYTGLPYDLWDPRSYRDQPFTVVLHGHIAEVVHFSGTATTIYEKRTRANFDSASPAFHAFT